MSEQKYENLILVLRNIGKEVQTRYKDKLKKPGRNGHNAIASGKLYDSVEYKVIQSGNSVKLYFVALDYWINVEEGRKVNGKYPPINVIRKWILQKKLKRTKGIEYKIQRSISVKGIKPRPFLKQSTKNLLKDYRVQIEEALNKDMEVSIDVTFKKSKQVLTSINNKNIEIKSKTI